MRDFFKWMWKEKQDLVVSTGFVLLFIATILMIFFSPWILLGLVLAFIFFGTVALGITGAVILIDYWVKAYKEYKKGRTG